MDWREKVRAEKQRLLENAKLWERYQNRENLESEMFRAYGEYESLDREFNDTNELVEEIRRKGLSFEDEARLTETESEFGYLPERVEALFGNRFPDLFAWYKDGQIKTEAAFEVYLRAKAVWKESEFKLDPDCLVNYEDVINEEEFKKGLEQIFDFRRAFDSSSNLLWVKFGTIDSDWYTACIQSAKSVLRNRRALGIDALVRMRSVTDSYIDVNIENGNPLTKLEIAIVNGEFVHRGVSKKARLVPAIERAIQDDRELVKFFLERGGPESVWTQRVAYWNLEDSNDLDGFAAREAKLDELGTLIQGLQP